MLKIIFFIFVLVSFEAIAQSLSSNKVGESVGVNRFEQKLEDQDTDYRHNNLYKYESVDSMQFIHVLDTPRKRAIRFLSEHSNLKVCRSSEGSIFTENSTIVTLSSMLPRLISSDDSDAAYFIARAVINTKSKKKRITKRIKIHIYLPKKNLGYFNVVTNKVLNQLGLACPVCEVNSNLSLAYFSIDHKMNHSVYVLREQDEQGLTFISADKDVVKLTSLMADNCPLN